MSVSFIGIRNVHARFVKTREADCERVCRSFGWHPAQIVNTATDPDRVNANTRTTYSDLS